MTDDDISDDWKILGRDLQFSREKLDFVSTAGGDLQLEKYRACLSQAIWSRLSTQKGELSLHPEYGSQVHTMVGEINNADNREKIRLFVIEALSQEPRIDTINSVEVVYDDTEKSTVRIFIYVTPILYDELTVNEGNPIELNLVYDFYMTAGGLTEADISGE